MAIDTAKFVLVRRIFGMAEPFPAAEPEFSNSDL